MTASLINAAAVILFLMAMGYGAVKSKSAERRPMSTA